MTAPSSFARINLEQARKQAKELVKAHVAGDRRSLDRIRWNHPRFRGQSDEQISSAKFLLADAQLVIARLHHFESWPRLLDYVETMERANPIVGRFENAADAIIAGDMKALRAALEAHPDLIRQRSTRAHRSTLLHYVSANGVEDYRQITPANILDITKLLLDRGAEVDATSEAYGGGSTTLGLVSTSAHPRARGVQIALIDLLLERGAAIDGERAQYDLVQNALANGCPEAANALASRGATIRTLYAAAGIGDLPRVRSMFPDASRKQREAALVVAGQQGHIDVATFLLDNGVDVNANDGMTALHYASGNGHLQMMKLLVGRGAGLEQLNGFDGTVLGSTLWFAHHVSDDEFTARDFPRIIEWLIAAGARTDAYPELMGEIDGVYRRAKR